MPTPISGRIPIAPDSHEMRHLAPKDKVNIRLALEPGNDVHRVCEIKVNSQQFNALQVANQAIQDTHEILFMGVGDQYFHSLSTNGETLKRQLVMRNRIQQQGITPLNSMWEARRYRVGNCGEMAMICAQLIASSGLNQPVSVVETRGRVDHTYVVIGDLNSNEQKVIADPWALFSRAMLERNFHFSSAPARVVHRFTPQYNPDMKAIFTEGGMVSRAEVERDFAPFNEALGNPDNKQLLKKAASNRWIYNQFHNSNNLGEYYRYDSGSRRYYVDQNMTKAEYQEIYSGPRPSAREPRSERYYPPTAGNSRTPQRSSSTRVRPASMYEPQPDLSDRVRRMSMSDEPRPRRQSFSADRPSSSRRQSFSAERQPYYSTPTPRPAYTEVRDVQPESSSHRSRRHRNRERERELPSLSSRFASFFSRR